MKVYLVFEESVPHARFDSVYGTFAGALECINSKNFLDQRFYYISAIDIIDEELKNE